MIANSEPLIKLPDTASPSAVQAATNASSNQHALINLIRLVKSLEARFVHEDEDVGEEYLVKRDWETVLYAHALLDALKEGNEQSSRTTSTLSDLEKTLDNVRSAFRARVSSPLPTPSLNPALIALPMTPNPSNPSYTSTVENPISSGKSSPALLGPSAPPSLANNGPTGSSNIPLARTTAAEISSDSGGSGVGVRKRKSRVDDYLAQRARGDLQDSSTSDLLPLKPVVNAKQAGKGLSDRDALLAGAGKGVGSVIGSAQLHEELGGQLADMSHRLKLNAVHFSNSLEKEKGILETSQEVLEKNLATTRSSKKQLSAVSKKGRGTTCLTLGVVILVMVLFIWTYMLIRFT
ncbi:hypothetical protein IAU59_006777 [Kwoniella sp. CBS 9459]